MTEALDTIQKMLEFQFVRNAIVVGPLIAVCASMLGVALVLRQMSFIGTGISNAAFGTTAVATAVQLSNTFFLVVPVTALVSVWLMKPNQKSRISGDAKLAMVAAGSMGIGYLIMNLYTKSANLTADVCSVLFGSTSILTLTQADVWLCIILSVTVLLLFVLLYNRIFSVTFDSLFMEATGAKPNVYGTVLAVVIGIVVAVSMRLVGSLLIAALIIFPAISAMSLFKSFRAVTVFSAAMSGICALLGILVSIVMGTPVGATIVAVNVAVFFACYGIGFILRSAVRGEKT